MRVVNGTRRGKEGGLRVVHLPCLSVWVAADGRNDSHTTADVLAPPCSADPVLQPEPMKPGEVPKVARDKNCIAGDHDGTDEEIRIRKRPSGVLEPGLSLSEELRSRAVDPEDVERVKELIDERSVLIGLPGPGRPEVEFCGGEPRRHDLVHYCRSPGHDIEIASEQFHAGVGVQHPHSLTSRPRVRAE